MTTPFNPGDPATAIALLHQQIAANPVAPKLHAQLAGALTAAGRLDEALSSARRVVELLPNSAPAHFNLANALRRCARLSDAANSYHAAISLKPDFVEAHDNLGCVLAQQHLYFDAAVSLQRALALRANSASTCANLADVLRQLGHLDEAIAAAQRAISLGANTDSTWNNLATSLREQGRLAESIACFRHALDLNPAAAEIHSNLIYTMWFSDDIPPADILAAHREWNDEHARSLAPAFDPHIGADRRPIRIAYVSPDFRSHIIGLLIEPILQHHDRGRCHITCYSSSPAEDAVTRRLRSHAHDWKNVAPLTDEQLADTIRDDNIDLLIDLASHMAHSRLLAFARRPAAVQASYLAYPATTGLSAMDYLITDIHLDPPGQTESLYTERLARLPGSYWCYRAPDNCPDPAPPPSLTNGFITFGSLNSFAKTTPSTIQTWSRILAAVPRSRLIVLIPGGAQHNAPVLAAFASAGIPSDRLTLVDRLPRDQYLALYNQIDIVLDPFPYNGHTTSIDALYMGVPVITLAGRHSVARAGVSLLTNVSEPSLIAPTINDYIALASALATNPDLLVQLRHDLRPRLRSCSVMDEPSHTRDLESLYLQMLA